jgi:hypothetical protein
VVNITNTLMMKDCPITFVDVVPTDVEESLLNLFQARYFMNRQLRKECVHWKSWTLGKFIDDTFTRWVELFHTVDATAMSAAKCLFQHFGRFGAPCQLRSDNGPHFVADLITEFLALVGVEHCLTWAYSKEENAIVERMNKEINRHLRALTYDNLTLENYKDSLPFVRRIINSNYSDRLKISAADLLFGKILSLDRGIFLPKEQNLSSKLLSKYASQMLSMQNNLLNASAKELLRTDLLHKASTDIFEHKEFLRDSYV